METIELRDDELVAVSAGVKNETEDKAQFAVGATVKITLRTGNVYVGTVTNVDTAKTPVRYTVNVTKQIITDNRWSVINKIMTVKADFVSAAN